ncbi:ATP-grasp domain-containing protein [Vibrio alginolyticus]|nr:ATP-grasp domain-containing protein [Vibrio alginolyticus]
MLTVLLLGARRRVYFINKLRNELEICERSFKLIYADTDYLDPAGKFCDEAILVPRLDNEDYRSKLVSIVRQHKIDLIIPWNDREISFINDMRDELKEAGANCVLPPHNIVELFTNKCLTADWCGKNNIQHPSTVKVSRELNPDNLDEINYPCIIKPICGQGSLGVSEIESPAELQDWLANKYQEGFILQQKVQGIEYTVDVALRNGDIVFQSPRRRVKVRGGECMISQVEITDLITSFVNDICSNFEFSGVFNVQIFVDKSSNEVSLIEFNPRFGGGSDLTIEAGGNIPYTLLSIYDSDRKYWSGFSSYNPTINNGLLMSRFSESVFS